jgi:O-antigen/teichoic acid export membrane protein
MQKELNSFVKSIVIYGFGNVSIKIIGLILLPLYTNTSFLSIGEYGAMGILDISSQILIAIFSLSLSSAYLRWYWDKEYFTIRKKIFFTCFATLSVMASILAVSGSMCSKTLTVLLWGNSSFSHALALMVVATSMQPLIDFTMTQMRADNKASFFVTSNIIRLIISLCATIYFVKYANRGLSGVYEAQIIGNISFLLLTSKFIFRHAEFSFSPEILREVLRYSTPLALASLSNVLLVVLDRYVLNYKTTPLDVGIYTQGFKIANTTKVFVVSSIQLALGPAIFKIMNRPDNKIIYSRIMTWFTIVVVYFSLFMSLYGLEITKLFTTGKVYFDAYKLIPLFSLSIIFSMLKDVSMTGLQITKRTKILGIMIAGIAAFNLALNMALVPVMGTYGSALSSLTSQLLFFILIFTLSQKYYKIPYRLDKTALVIITGIFLFLIGSLFNQNTLVIRIIVKTAALLLFPAILFIFKIFDHSELLMLTSTINNIKSLLTSSKKEEEPPVISENNNL